MVFWPRQDDRQFWAQQADFEQSKKQFSRAVRKKKVHSTWKWSSNFIIMQKSQIGVPITDIS